MPRWSGELRAIRKMISEVQVRDILGFGGIAMASYGAHQVYGPAGWIVAGVVLFWLGARR